MRSLPQIKARLLAQRSKLHRHQREADDAREFSQAKSEAMVRLVAVQSKIDELEWVLDHDSPA